MSEQPVVELGLFSDFLKKVGQVVVNISTVPQYIHDAVWGAVGDHIVHLIMNAFQTAPSFFILGLTGKLLFPPGVMVDPETGRPFFGEPNTVLQNPAHWDSEYHRQYRDSWRRPW